MPNPYETRPFRRRGEVKLLVALARGASIRKAAAEAKLNPQTVQRRLTDPAFRDELDRLRGEMLSRSAGRLANAMTAAATTLRKLLRGQSEMARLGAARAILELGIRLRESTVLEQRIAELEARVTRQEAPTREGRPRR